MSYQCDGTYDVYRETVRRARQQHGCDACDSAILPGDYYCDVFTLYDGNTDSLKRCGACQRTHEHLRELCRERGSWHNPMWPDERLNCGLEYESEWENEPPDDVAALPFLSAAERGALLKPPQKITPGDESKGSAR